MIRAPWATAALLISLLASSSAAAAPSMKGLALGLWATDEDDDGARAASYLDEIASVGADHVSLVVSWRQRDVRSNDIAPHAAVTVRDARLRKVIRAAHARGLKVFLFPILDVEVRRPLEWRGTIAPRDVVAWWASYEGFVMHYAKIAAEEKVGVFSVGSELVSTEVWQDRWRHLIAKVRKTFSGKLVYSANWDHYEEVTFWDRVDFVGVTAYNELTRSREATEDELARGWAEVRRKLTAFAAKVGRPLVLTEIGYTSQDGAAVHPWDYTSRAGVDLEEQRRCYAAFVRAWKDEPALAGVYFWMWFGEGGAKDTSYTPRGKPAEQVLRRWYRASEGK